MPQNFLACDREQELLLPPSLREWLPESHFAWFVIDAVAQMNLTSSSACGDRDYGPTAHGACRDPPSAAEQMRVGHADPGGRRRSTPSHRADATATP